MALNLGLDPIWKLARAIDWPLKAPRQPIEQGPRQHIGLARARWQLDELLATLQVEDKDARRDLLGVEPIGPTGARPGT